MRVQRCIDLADLGELSVLAPSQAQALDLEKPMFASKSKDLGEYPGELLGRTLDHDFTVVQNTAFQTVLFECLRIEANGTRP